MSVADEQHPLALSAEPPPGSSTASLIHDTVRYEIAARHEDCLRWFCLHPATPDELLIEIYESGLCLDELGHRKGPRILLQRMANETKYPEAIVTLGLQLYTDAGVSSDEFARFLNQHADHFWMLDTLVRQKASSADKESLLEGAVVAHPQSGHLTHMRQVNVLRRRAEHASDPQEIERLYASGEPAVWLALAKNRFTPRAVLERLTETKDVASARDIRNFAKDALRSG